MSSISPIKIVFLGHTASGKSYLLHLLKNIQSQYQYVSTRTIELHQLDLPQGSFEIYDTNNNKEEIITYLQAADITVIFFDTVRTDFEVLVEWLQLLPLDMPCIICGTKSDLSTRRFSYSKIENLTARYPQIKILIYYSFRENAYQKEEFLEYIKEFYKK